MFVVKIFVVLNSPNLVRIRQRKYLIEENGQLTISDSSEFFCSNWMAFVTTDLYRLRSTWILFLRSFLPFSFFPLLFFFSPGQIITHYFSMIDQTQRSIKLRYNVKQNVRTSLASFERQHIKLKLCKIVSLTRVNPMRIS